MNLTERRTRLATYLDGSGHLVAEVGGKGVGLDLLLAHEYPVPPAAVITTAAYQAAVAEERLDLLIRDLRMSPLPRPDRIAAESAAIERCFLSARIPDPVTTAIARIGGDLLRAGSVAVRSSATAEDLADASFAGQYLTITNVAGVEELQRAVRQCWASLWMPAARAYRKRHQVADSHVAMAVIIQTMVEPIWSGVAFSRDPRGRHHLLRIEAVAGLGEDLVSGKVTPADYLIRRDTLEIVEASGPVELEFLEDLARLSIQIEQTAQAPQDIEWAYTDSGISLLQVRPITVLAQSSILDDGLDTRNPTEVTYAPHGVVEMLPGVISPLLWSINAPMLENALRTTFSDLGGVPPHSDRSLVNRFRGRAALDLSSICEIAASIPGGNPAEVERQYLGRTIGEAPQEASPGGVPLLAAVRSRRIHNRISDEVDLLATVSPALAHMQLDLRELPVRRLVAYRQRIRDLAWRGYAAEVGASSAAGATYRALEVLLERWLSEPEAVSWAQVLTSGALDHSAVGAARSKILEEVLAGYSTDDVERTLRGPEPPNRTRLLALGPDGKTFLAALDSAVRSMGSKSVYGGPSWAEDEEWIWLQLQLMSRGEVRKPASRSSPSAAFADLSRLLAADKRWRTVRFFTGQLVDLRLRWLRRQVAETIRFLSLRERAKNALLVLGGEERRIILEAARRLVASRQLSHAEQIHYLVDADVEGMLFGACGVNHAELSRRRAAALECAAAGPLPDWFTGHPDTTPLSEVPATDRLEGWAASPGRATGPVRVITSLADGVRLRPGDVMVAHATDPSWTPLFLIAGGIVLEMGGPLSHAAIVAREFGLPAVLNARHATKVFSEGDTVFVDGAVGLVKRIHQGGPK
ncbi:MAG: PEP/pyruvate-binding domain-containing protein [Actinomycetota bacterium]|nr:PEP/pyruvate-binding domain-containing protein [Actinomycetota bacterium]